MPNLYEFSQVQLLEFSKGIVKRFMDRNGIDEPEEIYDRKLVAKPRGSYGCGVCIYPRTPDRKSKIIVTTDACAKPSTGYAMKWSFPGYVTDRTPVGVLAHEVGHHVDYVLRFPSKGIPKKGKISSYEPNEAESWAESMRLFILNPMLLMSISPLRFNYISDVVGLIPITSRDAVQRLEHWGASENILRMCKKKQLV